MDLTLFIGLVLFACHLETCGGMFEFAPNSAIRNTRSRTTSATPADSLLGSGRVTQFDALDCDSWH